MDPKPIGVGLEVEPGVGGIGLRVGGGAMPSGVGLYVGQQFGLGQESVVALHCIALHCIAK